MRDRAAAEQYRAGRDASEANGRAAKKLCKRLGVGEPYYRIPLRGQSGYDGSVLLSAEDAEKLAVRLEAKR